MIKTKLDNGLTVILEPAHAAPVVALQAWVNVGSADETEAESGLAHFHEHMLFKGTQKRGVGEIDQDVQGAGGDINAWTSFDQTVYHLVLPSEEYINGLDILADALGNSTFVQEEIENEAEVILEEIKQDLDQPSQKANQALFSLSFKTHPYRNPIIGNEKTVRSFTREDLLRFYKKWYAPNNVVLTVAGDFEPDEALKVITQLFGDMTQRECEHKRPAEPVQEGLRLKDLSEEVQESYLQIGFHSPGIGHPDLYALEMLSVILGQGESSRLVQKVKRQKQAVNYISAGTYSPRDQGLFTINVVTPPGLEKEALEAIFAEVQTLIETVPSYEELEKARTIIESEAIYHRETVQGLADVLGFYQTVAGDVAFEDKFYQGIGKVKASDIQYVAAKYFRQESCSIVCLTPKSTKAFQIEKERSWVQEQLKKVQKPLAVTKTQHKSAQKRTLSNGIRLLLKENRHTPMLSVRSVMLGGLRLETESTNGINHLVGRLLNQGTESRSAEEIVQKIDQIAGYLSGFSGNNSLGLQGEFLSKFAKEGLQLFSESLLEPSFPEEEIQRQSRLVLEDIRTQEDHPGSRSFQIFAKTLFQKHPYRLHPQGTVETVQSFSQKQLKEYYQKLRTPENIVISVTGDFESEQVYQFLEKSLGQLKGEPLEKTVIPEEPRPSQIRRAVEYKEKMQAHIVLGFQGITLFEEARYTFQVLNTLLSGQGGRLFTTLREQQSLVYTVSTSSMELLDPGYFVIYIATSPNKIEQAVNSTLQELKKLQEQLVSEEELARVKRYLKGSHAISLQRNGGQAIGYALNELYGLGHQTLEKYPEAIQQVSAKQLQEVARRYLTTESYTMALICPKGENPYE